jgi:hypothetical protein
MAESQAQMRADMRVFAEILQQARSHGWPHALQTHESQIQRIARGAFPTLTSPVTSTPASHGCSRLTGSDVGLDAVSVSQCRTSLRSLQPAGDTHPPAMDVAAMQMVVIVVEVDMLKLVGGQHGLESIQDPYCELSLSGKDPFGSACRTTALTPAPPPARARPSLAARQDTARK